MTTPEEQQAYAAALARLAQLQSNRAVTSLFEAPPSTDKGKPVDLNSLAIPEMLAWLRRAGYTPASLAASGLRCVHVAGTKGKGSVSALVASILSQYSSHQQISPSSNAASTSAVVHSETVDVRPVGLYTSPHVLSVRERIALNNTPLPPAKFTHYLNDLWTRFTHAARSEATTQNPAIPISDTDLDGPATKPFYFRFLTILALHVFVSEHIRSAVVECGIGGEYDATNILPAECITACVVTQLGIDHVGMLGDTVPKIAWHKAGVFKSGVKVFTRRLRGVQGEEVMEVLRARARERGAVLVEVTDEEVEKWEGVEGARLQGPFQKQNMALAVHAAREHLLRIGVKLEGRFGTEEWALSDIPPEFVQGLKEAALRGRCEVLTDAEGVEWYFDGAHTDDSLAGVGRWFAGRVKADGVRVLVFNQQEREPASLLKALLDGAQRGSESMFAHAIFTRNEEQAPAEGEKRDLSAQRKAEAAVRDLNATTQTTVHDSVQEAIGNARRIAAEARKHGKPCQILVTGSFHLVGPVLKIISDVEI